MFILGRQSIGKYVYFRTPEHWKICLLTRGRKKMRKEERKNLK